MTAIYRLVAFSLLTLLAFSSPAAANAADEMEEAESVETQPKVEFQTNFGKIVIELWPDKAPKTVENFLSYVNSGFYDGTIFHRVVGGFVIQGGGYDKAKGKKEVNDPIQLEANAPNVKYTLSMARTQNPNSATSQFFINLVSNASLDQAPGRPGYAVFGKVVEGTTIVDRIGGLSTRNEGGPFASMPEQMVIIEKATKL